MVAPQARAVFLDRDGTINRQVGHCGDPGRIELIEGAAAAVLRINQIGLLAIVVTNQSAVARGLITEAQVRRVNAEVALQVARASGGRFDGFYYCPHHPSEGGHPTHTRDCDCRKPAGGMFRQAAQEFGIQLAGCFMVGDADIDHQAAKAANAGIMTFQVPGDHNSAKADRQVDNLLEAVEQIARLTATSPDECTP